MKKSNLQREIQETFFTHLPLWNQWRKNALYRRTEDFVQWLLLDISEYRVSVRPHNSIQSLAVQFPSISLTLGNEIRNSMGHEWWISLTKWQKQADEITEYVLRCVQPSPMETLTNDSILEFLINLKDDHPSVLTALGIIHICLQNLSSGYAHLEKARNRYTEIPTPWAKVEANRITNWLKSPPEKILDLLRRDAKRGGEILGLK